MPRYKVWVKVVQDEQHGYCIIEDADNADEAGERAEELFEENPDAFTWDPLDVSKPDLPEVISVQEVA